jgi:hypothetical protein
MCPVSRLRMPTFREVMIPIFRPRPEVLLSPPIPLPLHTMAPRVILGEKWWEETRSAALYSTGFRCAACGTHRRDTKEHWLEGHELYAVDFDARRMTYVETVPLCRSCHCFVHHGRLRCLVQDGKMSRREHAEIMQHGKAVLRTWKLKRVEDPYNHVITEEEWGQWRLVINGIEHPPHIKSLADWKRKFRRGVHRK